MIFDNKVQNYVTKLMGFFIRKGKKTTIESKFENYMLNIMHNKKKNIYALLNICRIKTSTYIRYIERRRGRRSKFRIKLLDKEKGEGRSLLLVGRSLYKHTAKAPRQFKNLFTQELMTWASGNHVLKQKYKETHIIARKYAPYSWFSKKKHYLKVRKKPKNKLIIKKIKVWARRIKFLLAKKVTYKLSIRKINFLIKKLFKLRLKIQSLKRKFKKRPKRIWIRKNLWKKKINKFWKKN